LRPVIAGVLAENTGKSEKEIRAALRLAYPLTERMYWPYKVWLDEISRQLGKKRKPGRKVRTSKRVLRRMSVAEAREYLRKRQLPLPLFGEEKSDAL